MAVTFESKLCISEEEKQLVLNMLPSTFETIVTDYSCSTKGIVLEIRTNINNKDEALCWKKEFQEKTNTSFNSDSTYQENTQKTVFKRAYHCMHNTRPKSNTKRPHSKNTRCQAKLIINVKQKGMKRSKDIYLEQFSCKINLRHEHNHFSIDTADALRNLPDSWFESLSNLDLGILGNCTENGNLQNIIMKYEDDDDNDTNHDKEDIVNASVTQSSDNIKKEISLQENLIKTASDQELLEQTEANFHEATNFILKRFRTHPTSYLQPMNRFCELVKGVKTDSAMITALQSFGKDSGLPVIKENNCQGSKKVAVHRTVVAGGRNAVNSRTPKSHAYCKRKQTNVFDLPPTKKLENPESLFCTYDD